MIAHHQLVAAENNNNNIGKNNSLRLYFIHDKGHAEVTYKKILRRA